MQFSCVKLSRGESKIINEARQQYLELLDRSKINLQVRFDFRNYGLIRRAQGDRHLNQAFDARCVEFGDGDFWLLAQNHNSEPVATYCLRRFIVDDFYDLIRSLRLWFSNPNFDHFLN